jgi:hypothetical protein
MNLVPATKTGKNKVDSRVKIGLEYFSAAKKGLKSIDM